MRMEQETLQKIDELKCIMKKESDKGRTGSRKPHKVGIITDLEVNDFWWLYEVLSSHYFSGIIKKIRLINPSNINPKMTLNVMFSCTFYIYISSGYTRETFPAMRQRLGLLFECKNLIIIIDNLDDSSDSERRRILQENQDCAQCEKNVFLFSKLERATNYLYGLLNEDPLGSVRVRKREPSSVYGTSMRDHNQQQRRKTAHGTSTDLIKCEPVTPKSLRIFPKFGNGDHSSQKREIKRHQVGIFSRSTKKDYSWLVEMLKSEEFSSHVANIKSCLIFNKQTTQNLIDDINHCTFGILYHSKNRGTVNVTDLTDSLYDEELETLHMILGKENLLVIIDDLEDSSDNQQTRILEEQPSIAERAADLLLVSHEDKMDPALLRMNMEKVKTLLQGADESIENQPETPQQENRGAAYDPSLEESHAPHMPPAEQQSSYVERPTPTSSRSTVGIFSRSEESDYFWLKKLLASEEFGHKDVHCYKTLGNDEMFREMAFKVKFWILYHSLKNGKIRLTDSKDSLYDTELEQLSIKFGKRKVFVVIDDLDDIGHKMKQQILESQPSLGTMVAEIFLFTGSEKKNMDQDKHRSRMSKSTMDKISNMKKCLT
ncbi:uncharacterized protein LOC143785060 isoform X2 [Ranitomeya variabilis]|uniref:uncharacterized protein LOC143785060 isoform X2 n=1 Tax=Ranitomeya variabilis TaxID=490064 RepID=UPI004056D5A5